MKSISTIWLQLKKLFCRYGFYIWKSIVYICMYVCTSSSWLHFMFTGNDFRLNYRAPLNYRQSRTVNGRWFRTVEPERLPEREPGSFDSLRGHHVKINQQRFQLDQRSPYSSEWKFIQWHSLYFISVGDGCNLYSYSYVYNVWNVDSIYSCIIYNC